METGYIIVFILALFAFIAVAVVKNNGREKHEAKHDASTDEADEEKKEETDYSTLVNDENRPIRLYLGDFACELSTYEDDTERVVSMHIIYEYGYEIIFMETPNPVLKGIMDETKLILYNTLGRKSKDEFAGYLKKALEWHKICAERELDVRGKEMGTMDKDMFFSCPLKYNGGMDDHPRVKFHFFSYPGSVQRSFLAIFVSSQTTYPHLSLLLDTDNVEKIVAMLEDEYVETMKSNVEGDRYIANELLK